MKHLLRPYRSSHGNPGFAALRCAALAAATCLVLAPQIAHAQAQTLAPIFSDPDPMVVHASAAGYLGVEVSDVDADKAQALKLKEVRGALITLIDHDAPAGQIGLKVNDVVLAVNGQNVESAEQLRRLLREIPPGRKISLEISRDGNIQTLAVQLVDRKALDHDIWGKIGNDVSGVGPAAPAPTMGVMAGGDAPIPPSGFHMSLFTSTLNVGAMVEPLTSQMAEYFGVQGGLMIKQVSKKSEAAAAGFKAFDVILKVGSDSIMTLADWDRALRSNQGKPVQVTILRDKKQQTLTLQVDSKHRGAVEFDDLFANGDAPELAELVPALDPDMMRSLTAQAQADAEAAAAQARKQADAMRQQLGNMRLQMSQEQMEQLRQQTEKLRESMKNFQIDPKQMQQQLQQQMEQFRKSFNEEQMERFKQQMEEWREQSAGHFV
jgi:membrane-associated protease RseP (regulator of RpoE activity)